MKANCRKIIPLFVGSVAASLMIALPASAGRMGKEAEKIALKDGKLDVSSSFKTDDAKDKVQKQPCKVFTVEFKGGRNYRIDMTSKELDSYLRLEDSTGKQLARDDDSGGFVNARINFSCLQGGEYRVICTTFSGGTGAFLLSIRETVIGKPVELTLKDGMATIDSKLTSTDVTDAIQTHSVCKLYAVRLSKGKSYQIDMSSKEIDPYLRLENAAGNELAKDDDSGGGRDARIHFSCPGDADYRIIATTYYGGTGNFTLTVKETAKMGK